MNAKQLIPVTPSQIGGHVTQLVNARLLHDFLDVGRDFSTWIRSRIQEYGFVADLDYLVIRRQAIDSPNLGNQTGRGGDHRSVDYFVSLDMAKELAMVERTPRGRQARRYFIECERQLQRLQHGYGLRVVPEQVAFSRADLQAVNRQAWSEVAAQVYTAFHARREALLQERTERTERTERRKPSAEHHSTEPVYLPQGFRPTWAL